MFRIAKVQKKIENKQKKWLYSDVEFIFFEQKSICLKIKKKVVPLQSEFLWSIRLAVRMSPSHGGDTGSSPVCSTINILIVSDLC